MVGASYELHKGSVNTCRADRHIIGDPSTHEIVDIPRQDLVEGILAKNDIDKIVGCEPFEENVSSEKVSDNKPSKTDKITSSELCVDDS